MFSIFDSLFSCPKAEFVFILNNNEAFQVMCRDTTSYDNKEDNKKPDKNVSLFLMFAILWSFVILQ